MTKSGRLRLVVSLIGGVLAVPTIVGCGSRYLSCESYDKVYQEQLDKYFFYVALAAGIEAGNATRDNPEYERAVSSRDLLLESADEVAASAAADGCYVDQSRLFSDP